ncbi:ComEA family DNA-binding protein [Bifidobacterium gallicum]|nr:helix-hairpin-helix domain-containing protein [Bifidobacterium gallicum]EFA23148.1 comEA protein [Bifidobacterium gallicum DSM 20093 = LMG 11596]
MGVLHDGQELLHPPLPPTDTTRRSSERSASLESVVRVRASDGADDAVVHQRRTAARVLIDPKHAIIVILVLLAVLAASVTMLVQQALNMGALSVAGDAGAASSQTDHGSAHSSGSGQPDTSGALHDDTTPTPQSSSDVGAHPSDVQASPTPSASSPSAPSPSAPAQTQPAESSDSVDEGLIDLNTANADQLQTINGVGPVMAARIVEYRNAHGPFTSVNELMAVKGIGAKTLAKIAPFVTVNVKDAR